MGKERTMGNERRDATGRFVGFISFGRPPPTHSHPIHWNSHWRSFFWERVCRLCLHRWDVRRQAKIISPQFSTPQLERMCLTVFPLLTAYILLARITYQCTLFFLVVDVYACERQSMLESILRNEYVPL